MKRRLSNITMMLTGLLLSAPLTGFAQASTYNDGPDYSIFLVGAIVGLIIAFFVIMIMKGSMKTARQQRAAAFYITKEGLQLTGKQDRYLYKKTTRRPLEKKTKDI